MKKKALALLLALCLFFSLSPPSGAAAASDVCFVACNDELLKLGSAASFQRSTLYVPYTVFVYFGVYYSYYSSGSTATLYTSSKQIYFELDSGGTYDGEGNFYTSPATYINGQVYVSADFVCRQFGLSWSYIYGTGSGDICRIKNGTEILSDSQFLAAADSLMTERYNAYIGSSPDPGGPASPSPSGNGEKEGCLLYLSFQGLPSGYLLDALKSYAVPAAFFLTADEVAGDPDTVRRIVGEGHGIGVLCAEDPAGEYTRAAGLIFDAARVGTVLIAAADPKYDDACASAAAENGLVFWRYKIDGVRDGAGISYASYVTTYMAFCVDRADVRILCCDATDGCISSVLYYIAQNDFDLMRVCEVGSPA